LQCVYSQKRHRKLGTRREIKNVNSFKFIEKAINSEIEWQIDEIESGRKIEQSTVLYDSNTNLTRAMRSKEEANDYRYFPDPDLLPVVLDETLIEEIRASCRNCPLLVVSVLSVSTTCLNMMLVCW
jgi:aspartyl-tRNA(Asn)/glutamyl-tRNA(Gln) amidotransferase subunit B